MAIRNYNTQLGSCGVCGNSNCCCTEEDGCPCGVCPDFTIRRNDTMPSLRICIDDCGEPVPLEGKVLEVNMWAKGRLKKAILATDLFISLADNIGFFQVKIGDVLYFDHPRSPERMQVASIDEDTSVIGVIRGVAGTAAKAWKRGERLKIFRIMNAPAICEMTYMDIQQVDGTTIKDQPTQSLLVYDWQPGDTSLAGCFWLEFKLLKMTEKTLYTMGGIWPGPTVENSQKYFFTGSIMTDGSVLLSYDGATGKYIVPAGSVWTGPTHVYTDGKNYTGTAHMDGSVILDTSGVSMPEHRVYDRRRGIPPGAIGSEGSTFDAWDAPDEEPPGFSRPLPGYEWNPDFYRAGDPQVRIPDPYPDFRPYQPQEQDVLGVTPPTTSLGLGVEWVRRFPTEGEGFLIKVSQSPTLEL